MKPHVGFPNRPANEIQASPSETEPARAWHPKLTGYRFLVVFLMSTFGVSKAILTYLHKTIASATFEWILTVLIGLSLFWLRLYEIHYPQSIPWLFEKDYWDFLWRFLAVFHHPAPSYKTSRRSSIYPKSKRERSHPPLLGYHLLVSVSVIVVGFAKAILTYYGFSTVPNTLDWIFTVVFANSLYWLGLYEGSPLHTLPVLFESDYAGRITSILSFDEKNIFGYTVLHALGVCIFAGLATYFLFVTYLFVRVFTFNVTITVDTLGLLALLVPLLLMSFVCCAAACVFIIASSVKVFTGRSLADHFGRWADARPNRDPVLRLLHITKKLLKLLAYNLMHAFGFAFLVAYLYCLFSVAKSVWTKEHTHSYFGIFANWTTRIILTPGLAFVACVCLILYFWAIFSVMPNLRGAPTS